MLYQWSAEEAVGRDIIALLSPEETKSAVLHNFEELNRDGHWEGEFDVKRKDGTTIAAHITNTYLKDRSGNNVGFIGISRDISTRRKAEEKLAQYQNIVSSSSDLIALLDTGYRYMAVNRAYGEAFGLAPEEVVGRIVNEVFGEEFFETVIRPQADLCLHGEQVRYQSWVDYPAIGRQFVDVNYYPYCSDAGEIIGFVVNARTITEQKRAEEEREKLEFQLSQSQKMESIGRLAGGVAHDFNNLLTVISNYADLALDDLPEESPVRTDIREILEAGNRATQLTRQLLTFSRSRPADPVVLYLNDVVRGMENLLRRLVGEDLEFVTTLDRNVGLVLADGVGIEQALMNLVVNARDAMPLGGKLVIETSNVFLENSDPTMTPKLDPGNYSVLTVTDSGCGMSADVQAHAFEPFFTTKEKGHGSGLGLATVYGVVQQCNGSIQMQSNPGEGTTFRLFLPWSSDENVEAEQAERRERSVGEATILVAEDEVAVRRVACRILTETGYEVIAPDGPLDALRILEERSAEIDLLLTDVIMPDMSGQELAARLKSIAPEVPVAFMSGYTDDTIARHGVLDPGAFFVAKPFRRENLLEVVAKALQERTD